MTRKGDFIVTASGIAFWPLDPRPEEILLMDIGQHLCRLSRWTGATRTFYSVAEHSWRVAALVGHLGGDAVARAQGMFHDAGEAYMNDMARPVKHLPELAAYRDAEHSLMGDIFVRFGLPREMHPLVKQADDILLGWEARDLMHPGNERLRKYHQYPDGTPLPYIPVWPLMPHWGPEDGGRFVLTAMEYLRAAGLPHSLTNAS